MTATVALVPERLIDGSEDKGLVPGSPDRVNPADKVLTKCLLVKTKRLWFGAGTWPVSRTL